MLKPWQLVHLIALRFVNGRVLHFVKGTEEFLEDLLRELRSTAVSVGELEPPAAAFGVETSREDVADSDSD